MTSAKPKSYFNAVHTTKKSAIQALKLGNYNIPAVCRSWHTYVTNEVPTVFSSGTNCWYLGYTSLCNTYEDMLTGGLNTAMPGYQALKTMYGAYVPDKFQNRHSYSTAINSGVQNELACGTYYMIQGYSTAGANPFSAFFTTATPMQLQQPEQYLNAYIQPYTAKWKKFVVNDPSKARTFSLKTSVTLKRFLGRQTLDPWPTSYAAVSTTNPAIIIYCHSMLLWNMSTINPVSKLSRNQQIVTSALWNTPQPAGLLDDL